MSFSQYNIKAVNTCKAAPNMNAFVERLIGTVRREALDHFLLFSKKQVKNIITEFVEYYNFVVLVRLILEQSQNNIFRIHQGI